MLNERKYGEKREYFHSAKRPATVKITSGGNKREEKRERKIGVTRRKGGGRGKDIRQRKETQEICIKRTRKLKRNAIWNYEDKKML